MDSYRNSTKRPETPQIPASREGHRCALCKGRLQPCAVPTQDLSDNRLLSLDALIAALLPLSELTSLMVAGNPALMSHDAITHDTMTHAVTAPATHAPARAVGTGVFSGAAAPAAPAAPGAAAAATAVAEQVLRRLAQLESCDDVERSSLGPDVHERGGSHVPMHGNHPGTAQTGTPKPRCDISVVRRTPRREARWETTQRWEHGCLATLSSCRATHANVHMEGVDQLHHRERRGWSCGGASAAVARTPTPARRQLRRGASPKVNTTPPNPVAASGGLQAEHRPVCVRPPHLSPPSSTTSS